MSLHIEANWSKQLWEHGFTKRKHYNKGEHLLLFVFLPPILEVYTASGTCCLQWKEATLSPDSIACHWKEPDGNCLSVNRTWWLYSNHIFSGEHFFRAQLEYICTWDTCMFQLVTCTPAIYTVKRSDSLASLNCLLLNRTWWTCSNEIFWALFLLSRIWICTERYVQEI